MRRWYDNCFYRNTFTQKMCEVTLKPSDSPLWKGLLWVKEKISEDSFDISEYAATGFWEDPSLGFSI
jgi:hypothetical protein